MTQRIGSLIVSIEGKELSAEDHDILAHPLVGGLILFARNYSSKAQLFDLCQRARAASKNPLLIMVDQEGGRVQRFKNEFTLLPPLTAFGRMYDDYPKHALELTRNAGWLMAAELLDMGIDLSLAPVLDMNKGVNDAIGDRAFHSHSEVIGELAIAYIQGMHEAGMASTGKHFPGHGSVSADSHKTLPYDERNLAEIEKDDMIPFANLINAGITAIMPAHIIFTKVDKHPVGYSRIWLQDILRKRLGFNGPLFSDDLNMQAANLSAHFTDRFIATREAGCDFALLCNNRQGVIQVLDDIAHVSHTHGLEKWGSLQGRFPKQKIPLQENNRWKKTRELLRNLCATSTTE